MTAEIVFHAGCPDGRTAAWLLGRVLGQVRWVPYSHGDPAPVLDGREVWLVDLAFPFRDLRDWAGTEGRVVVLDHHLSAARMLADVAVPFASSIGCVTDRSWRGVTVTVDLGRSGAGLAAAAAEILDPGLSTPEFVADIEDRDLWHWSRPGARQVCAAFDALTAATSDPGEIDRVAACHRDDLVELGTPLVAAFDAEVAALVEHAQLIEVTGFQVPMAQVPHHRFGSWVGHRLLERFPSAAFAGYWLRDAAGRLQVGLRSEDHRLDVSALAARLGGGGHRNASGFVCTDLASISTPPSG